MSLDWNNSSRVTIRFNEDVNKIKEVDIINKLDETKEKNIIKEVKENIEIFEQIVNKYKEDYDITDIIDKEFKSNICIETFYIIFNYIKNKTRTDPVLKEAEKLLSNINNTDKLLELVYKYNEKKVNEIIARELEKNKRTDILNEVKENIKILENICDARSTLSTSPPTPSYNLNSFKNNMYNVSLLKYMSKNVYNDEKKEIIDKIKSLKGIYKKTSDKDNIIKSLNKVYDKLNLPDIFNNDEYKKLFYICFTNYELVDINKLYTEYDSTLQTLKKEDYGSINETDGFFDSDGFEYNGDIILDDLIKNIDNYHPYFFTKEQFKKYIKENFVRREEFVTNKYLHGILSNLIEKSMILDLYAKNIINIPNGFDIRKEKKGKESEKKADVDLHAYLELEIWLADYFEALIFTLYLYIKKLDVKNYIENKNQVDRWIINLILKNSIEGLEKNLKDYMTQILNGKEGKELYEILISSKEENLKDYIEQLSRSKTTKTDGYYIHEEEDCYIKENIDGYQIDPHDDLYNYF